LKDERDGGGSSGGEPLEPVDPEELTLEDPPRPARTASRASPRTKRASRTNKDGAPSAPEPAQEFFIPVHGFVRLTEPELAVVNHPAFQRLGEVYQLGQTHLVYRGARHSRLEHALGTLFVAQIMIDNLARNGRVHANGDRAGEWELDAPLQPPEVAFARLAALLHDIGHLPAGHTLEDELALLGKHDAVERLDLVMDRTTWRGSEERPLRAVVDEEYAAVAEASGLGLSAAEVVKLLIGKDVPDTSTQADDDFRIEVCRDLIGNTICADLLDYLHRDWHHLGKHKYFDVRLMQYLELRRSAETREPVLVINLRGGEKVRTDGVSAILDLLESRYQLGEIALYHRAKLSAGAMLERVVSELAASQGAKRDDWTGRLIESLLDCSDLEMLALLEEEAANLGEDDAAAAQGLIEALRLRRLYKPIYERFEYHLGADRARVQELYAPGVRPDDGAGDPFAGQRAAADRRLAALHRLEEDFDLPAMSLVMYCPPPLMNTKIADVRILADERVTTLNDYEENAEGDAGLTGGHLQAQKRRFRRLWRVYFACAPATRELLEERHALPTLKRAIGGLVLGRGEDSGRSPDELALAVAEELKGNPASHFHDKELGLTVAARGAEPPERYPSGARTLRSLLI
jgi:HD superfamily phosphohydrolase